MKIIDALNGFSKSPNPIWIMRQAGRYLPEYRELRKKSKSFMDFCLNQDMTLEATLQPIKRFDFDAAIIFSDILVIPHFLGQKVSFKEGVGPILEFPDWDKIINGNVDSEILTIYKIIKNVRSELAKEKALLGFVGCPWTLASYMINLGKTDDFLRLINFVSNWPLFEKLINKLIIVIANHAIAQLKSGADVVQLFESWAGVVPSNYRQKWLFEPAIQIINLIRMAVPDAKIIYYGRGVAKDAICALESLNIAFGISEDVDLLSLPATQSCLQGNLDSKKLRDGSFKADTLKILEFARDRPFIVNLGHGILPDTPIAHVEEFVHMVRNGK